MKIFFFLVRRSGYHEQEVYRLVIDRAVFYPSMGYAETDDNRVLGAAA